MYKTRETKKKAREKQQNKLHIVTEEMRHAWRQNEDDIQNPIRLCATVIIPKEYS
jgi:hypothetical protein